MRRTSLVAILVCAALGVTTTVWALLSLESLGGDAGWMLLCLGLGIVGVAAYLWVQRSLEPYIDVAPGLDRRRARRIGLTAVFEVLVVGMSALWLVFDSIALVTRLALMIGSVFGLTVALYINGTLWEGDLLWVLRWMERQRQVNQ